MATAPLSDDFSYTKTALEFARTGHFVYNGWATAMLGWQIIWAALLIKIFGFSFTIVRLSITPVAMASAYLFHQVLVRFGITPRNAVLGTLAIGLSPLYLFLAATYLTDVPGVFVIVLCLYMCQRSVVAADDNTAVQWLIAAAVVNSLGGTVRQTSWLGGLVMVPSTAWYLRRRSNMLAAGSIMFLLSGASIYLCMNWAKRQPFFVTEPFIIHARFSQVYQYMIGQWGKALLLMVLILAPILVGWLPAARKLTRAAILRIVFLLLASGVALAMRAKHGLLYKWIAPWLIPVLQTQGMVGPDHLLGGYTVLSTKVLAMLSMLVVALALIVGESLLAESRDSTKPPVAQIPSWREALWLTGPFAASYMLVLVPRSATSFLQDRYLLGVMPIAIIFLLLIHQHWVAPKLPSLSIVVLVGFALYTIGATHDIYANLRASERAVEQLRSDGVPRTAIVEGFGPDGWVQLQTTGYFNVGNMVLADKYFKPRVPPWPIPESCVDFLPQQAEPALHPQYFIAATPTPCYAPTSYAPVHYRAWLPPFHRMRFIGKAFPPLP